MTNPAYRGFTFNNIHSGDLGVYLVSKSNSYSSEFSGKLKNNTIDVQGYEGEYFFGASLGAKTITLNCVVYQATENTLRNIQYWLRPGQNAQLIVDGTEYKYTNVSLGKTIKFTFLPFEGGNETNLYNGSFSITFTAFDPYSYSTFYAQNDFEFDSEDAPWYWESGILYEDWSPNVEFDYSSAHLVIGADYVLYNGGNAPAKPIIAINGTWDSLTISNDHTGQEFTLGANTYTTTDTLIDCKLARVVRQDLADYLDDPSTGTLNNSLHTGDFIELNGTGIIEEGYAEWASYTVSETVAASPSLDWGTDGSIIGRHLIADGFAAEVTAWPSGDNDTVTVHANTGLSGVKSTVLLDANTVRFRGTNINISRVEFKYRYVYY